jgi:hypothetical protein
MTTRFDNASLDDGPLLTGPEGISPEWLMTVLWRSGAISHPVATCHISRFAEGSALLSRLYRVRLGYASLNARGPRTVVVKLASNEPEQLIVAEVLGLYQREAFVYSQLSEQLPYRTPTCYLAVAAEHGRATTLVLEDLATCSPVDQIAGAPWRVVTDCIDAMAAQHATWSDVRQLEGLGDVLWSLAHPVYPAALSLLFEPGWEVAREVLAGTIDTRLAEFADRWSTECGRLLQRLGREPTLLHGDWRADNLLYDHNELVVVDFQIAGTGSGGYDLAYFISQSVASEVRRPHHREIVGRYVAALEARGVRRDRRTVWDDYRAALLVCLVYPIAAFRSWDSQNERGRALIKRMLSRAANAIEATGALQPLG